MSLLRIAGITLPVVRGRLADAVDLFQTVLELTPVTLPPTGQARLDAMRCGFMISDQLVILAETEHWRFMLHPGEATTLQVFVEDPHQVHAAFSAWHSANTEKLYGWYQGVGLNGGLYVGIWNLLAFLIELREESKSGL